MAVRRDDITDEYFVLMVSRDDLDNCVFDPRQPAQGIFHFGDFNEIAVYFDPAILASGKFQNSFRV